MSCEKKNMDTGGCRVYVQWAQRPNTALLYSGVSESDFFLEGVTMNDAGDEEIVYAPHPFQRGKSIERGTIVSNPDPHEATLKLTPRCGGLPRMLMGIDCKFNVFDACNCCGPMGDPLTSWKDGFGILFSGIKLKSVDMGDLNATETKALEFSGGCVVDDIIPIGALSFGGVTNLAKETSDVVFGGPMSCGECDAPDDGTTSIYWAMIGDVAAKPAIIWTADGGVTRTTTTISTAANAEVTTKMAIVNGRLVVVGSGGYYWADIDSNTKAPGTFSKVTTGFGANAPYAVHSDGANTFFAGAAGTIYATTDVTASVTQMTTGLVAGDLKAIHGCGNLSVAVGSSGAMLVSSNLWQSAKAITLPGGLSSANLVSVWVKNSYEWWITSAAGDRAYTLDGGNTWSTPAATGAAANSIVFANDSVGWHSSGTSIFGTWTVGNSWTKTTPRVGSLPSGVTQINEIAVPEYANVKKAANIIAIAGKAGTAGIAIVGSPSYS